MVHCGRSWGAAFFLLASLSPKYELIFKKNLNTVILEVFSRQK
jgi:hypothetical protein